MNLVASSLILTYDLKGFIEPLQCSQFIHWFEQFGQYFFLLGSIKLSSWSSRIQYPSTDTHKHRTTSKIKLANFPFIRVWFDYTMNLPRDLESCEPFSVRSRRINTIKRNFRVAVRHFSTRSHRYSKATTSSFPPVRALAWLLQSLLLIRD